MCTPASVVDSCSVHYGKYPPAEPGALGDEPLKAAISGAFPPYFRDHSLSPPLEPNIPFPKRHLVCGASRDIAAIAAAS
jgi:hypothetical protein